MLSKVSSSISENGSKIIVAASLLATAGFLIVSSKKPMQAEEESNTKAVEIDSSSHKHTRKTFLTDVDDHELSDKVGAMKPGKQRRRIDKERMFISDNEQVKKEARRQKPVADSQELDTMYFAIQTALKK
mgnify:CR=1 FL=1